MKRFLHRGLAAVLITLCSCATPTVTPPLPRHVRIDPDPIDFKEVFVGDVKNMPAVVINNTAAALNVAASSVQAGSPPAFSPGVATPALPLNVPPSGGALPFRFDFKPTDVGDFTGKWTVKIAGIDYTLDLRGKGVGVERSIQGIGFVNGNPGISETNGIDLGPVIVGTNKKQRIEVVKGGQNLIVKIPFQITEQSGNPQADAFKLVKPTAPPATLTLVDITTPGQLAPNERRTIGTEVEFKPPRIGTYKATLTISDANGWTVMRIFLKGVGVPAGD